MKMRTNYIRWNRDMERNCLGRAWQTYAQNNVSQKNVKNKTGNVEEVKTAEENKLLEEIFLNENVDAKLGNSCPEPDISESMTEDLQENISESTDEINLKTFMENAMKENEIHKTNTYATSKKIHWNEDMLKRCLGTFFSTSPKTNKRSKKWIKKESNTHYDNVVSKNEELVSDEISYDNAPQEDYKLDNQIYDGEIIEKVNEEDQYYDYTGSETNNGEIDEDEKLQEEPISLNDNEPYDQDNLGKFEKISWSILSDIDDEDFDKEMDSKDENIEESNSNSYEDNYKDDSEESYEDDYKDDSEDSYEDEYKNDHEESYEDGYENDYEDSYAQEDLFNDKYPNDNNGTDQYLNEVADDNFETDYQENESLTYSDDDKVFDFGDIGPIEMLELEIANQTINNTDWDYSWNEYDVSNNQSQGIETVDSFIDYGISQEEYSDYNFDSESQIETPEYMADYDNISYGQSVECRIIT